MSQPTNKTSGTERFPAITPDPTKAVDPVCGMSVNPARALNTTHRGRPYYFCSPSCLDRFRVNPEQFLDRSPRAESMPHDSDGVQYFCPMHPEVLSSTPGICPKCGMALEPQLPSPD